MEMKVNVKSVSGKRNRITAVSVTYSRDNMSVRELIEETDYYCVSEYNSRMENTELLSALLPAEIADKAAQGKISFGTIYGENRADLKKAQADALKAFSDGVVAVFADDRRLEDMEEILDLKHITSLTFIKLVMLAGRMW